MKISFYTLGCKLNQAETNEIADILQKNGHSIVPFAKPADVSIIRACAVTQNASQTTREIIRQTKRRGIYVIASGCLENRDLPEIDYIAQTTGDIIKKISTIKHEERRTLPSKKDDLKNKTRKFIKIQTGCNFNCTYCVIPQYRGKSKSRPLKQIIKNINDAYKSGFHEIVLTGVNICQYKNNNTNFAGLINKILSDTKIERIRLGSLDPRLIDLDLINKFKNTRLMPHAHLSLQSGSDTVLKRMNRGYTIKIYLSIVKRLKSINPLFSFTTDVIVGFPGESDAQFSDSIIFLKKIGFSKIHVFHYSKRPNTIAANYSDQIQDSIKSKRVKKLIQESKKISDKYIRNLYGKTRNILFEQKKNGYWLGYSPEYILIRYKSSKNLKNKIVSLKLTKSMLRVD